MAPSTCLIALATLVAAVDAAPTTREVHHLDTTAPSTCCTTTTPAPGSPVVVRRNILDLTSEEQSRFLSAIEQMQEPGYGGPFQMMEALHGHGPEAACARWAAESGDSPLQSSHVSHPQPRASVIDGSIPPPAVASIARRTLPTGTVSTCTCSRSSCRTRTRSFTAIATSASPTGTRIPCGWLRTRTRCSSSTRT